MSGGSAGNPRAGKERSLFQFAHFPNDVDEAQKGSGSRSGAGSGTSPQARLERSKSSVGRAQRHSTLCQKDFILRLLREG